MPSPVSTHQMREGAQSAEDGVLSVRGIGSEHAVGVMEAVLCTRVQKVDGMNCGEREAWQVFEFHTSQIHTGARKHGHQGIRSCERDGMTSSKLAVSEARSIRNLDNRTDFNSHSAVIQISRLTNQWLQTADNYDKSLNLQSHFNFSNVSRQAKNRVIVLRRSALTFIICLLGRFGIWILRRIMKERGKESTQPYQGWNGKDDELIRGDPFPTKLSEASFYNGSYSKARRQEKSIKTECLASIINTAAIQKEKSNDSKTFCSNFHIIDNWDISIMVNSVCEN